MSPRTTFKPGQEPQSLVAALVLDDPSLIHEIEGDALVLAVRSELLARPDVADGGTAASLTRALEQVADQVGTLSGTLGEGRSADDLSPVGVWRLRDGDRNSIDEARRLRRLVGDEDPSRDAPPLVSPNHAAIVAGGRTSGCPAGPPSPSAAPEQPFIPDRRRPPGVHVALLDTGYIKIDPPHKRLDSRVKSVRGPWFDSSVDPPQWRLNPPDRIRKDAKGRLLQIVGHGTFNAGLIAHACPDAAITVVGHREAMIPLDPPSRRHQYRLWASELSLARSLLQRADADVIQCSFAFPTLDDYPSLPFAEAMRTLRRSTTNPGIAVVAPAGNEDASRRYWPAALDDVIGVAATNRAANHRADFSNWGSWVSCCTRGEYVRSTYIRYHGRVEGEDPPEVETFDGWARWDGTSFAAPKVAGAIAQVVFEHPGTKPVDAFTQLVEGAAGVPVSLVNDQVLFPYPGVTLPQLHLG